MPISSCKKCQKEFAYDFSIGLNIKYYETEATPHYFRAGGDAPSCCPNCETECTLEAQNTVTDYSYKTYLQCKSKDEPSNPS